MKRITEYDIVVPIYNDYIIVQTHKHNATDFIKENKYAAAGFWRDEDGVLHIWLPEDIYPWRTIPHECVHVANNILSERRVTYYPTEDEALAYLVGFLCENVATAFHKLYPDFNKNLIKKRN